MSFLAGLATAAAPALVSGLAGLAGAHMQATNSKTINRQLFEYNQALAEQADRRQFEYNKALFDFQNRTGFKSKMKGLKESGLNPVLAGDMNPGGMPGFTSHVAEAAVGDQSKAISQGVEAISNAMQMLLNAREQESRIGLNETNADTLKDRLKIDKDKAFADISYLKAKTLSESEIPNRIKKQIQLMDQEMLSKVIQGKLYDSLIPVNNAREKFYKEMSKRDSIGYKGNVVHFNLGDLFKYLSDFKGKDGGKGFIEPYSHWNE